MNKENVRERERERDDRLIYVERDIDTYNGILFIQS